MKKNILLTVLFLSMLMSLPGCEIIGGIFKTGVGVGVFIVVVILIAIFLIARMIRRR